MTSTVLLVEDNHDDALLMRHAWRKAGVAMPLHIVRDADEAITYFRDEGPFGDRVRFPLPCLVLLDLRLPGKSGFEVLHWIRHESDLPKVPVVILSSSRQRMDVQKGYSLGANSYLEKPSTLSSLCELVRDIRQYWLRWNVLVENTANALPLTIHA